MEVPPKNPGQQPPQQPDPSEEAAAAAAAGSEGARIIDPTTITGPSFGEAPEGPTEEEMALSAALLEAVFGSFGESQEDDARPPQLTPGAGSGGNEGLSPDQMREKAADLRTRIQTLGKDSHVGREAQAMLGQADAALERIEQRLQPADGQGSGNQQEVPLVLGMVARADQQPAQPEAQSLEAMDKRAITPDVSQALRGSAQEEVDEVMAGTLPQIEDVVTAPVIESAGNVNDKITGDLASESSPEATTHKSSTQENSGISRLPRTAAEYTNVNIRRAVTGEHRDGKVWPITSWETGPGKLEQRLTETVYDTDGAAQETEHMPPTSAAPMAVAARVFGQRASALIAEGRRSEDNPFRVSVLGSGPGTDAAIFLDELQASHPHVYDRTTVEVSDLYETQLQAAQDSPQLQAHNENDSGARVEFAQRNAATPNYQAGQVPDLVIASNVISAFPPHMVSQDRYKYDPEHPNRVIGELEEPVRREVVSLAGVASNMPLVRVDPQTAQVKMHRVSMLGRTTYLDQLKDPADRAALLPQLAGRLLNGQGPPEPNVPPPLAHALTPKIYGQAWEPDEIAGLPGFFGSPGVTTNRYYNYLPGVTDFIEGTLGHEDRPQGMMIMVVDSMRTAPGDDVRGVIPNQEGVAKTSLTGMNQHAGDGFVTWATVEGWDIARQAREQGAHVRYTGGRPGDIHAMLIDGERDVVQTLTTEAAFTEALLDLAPGITGERQNVRREVIVCLTEAVNRFERDDPGQLRFAYETVERIYSNITNPSIYKDHTLMTEIANLCNRAQLHSLGEIYGRRALNAAGHTSVNSYRAFAAAQLGQNNVAGAIQTLEAATGVSKRNPDVWDELRSLYRTTEKWEGFVAATMEYMNMARGLTTHQITKLLVELCEAQERYADKERDNETPYTIVTAQIRTAATHNPDEDTYAYSFQVDDTPAALPTNRQVAARAYTLYRTALETAEMLASLRNAMPDDAQELQTQKEIARLRRGLRRCQEGRGGQFPAPYDEYMERTVFGHAGGQGLGQTALIGTQEGVRDSVGVALAVVTNTEADFDGLPVGEMGDVELVDEQDPVQRRKDFARGLHERLQLGERPTPEEIGQMGERIWKIAAKLSESNPTLAARRRLIALQLLTAWPISSEHVRAMTPALRSSLLNGGDYTEMLSELADFRRELVNQEKAAWGQQAS